MIESAKQCDGSESTDESMVAPSTHTTNPMGTDMKDVEADISQDNLGAIIERIRQISSREGTAVDPKVAGHSGGVPEIAIEETQRRNSSETLSSSSSQPVHAVAAHSSSGDSQRENTWKPLEPKSLKDAGLTDTQIEHLVLKSLNAFGELSGRDLARLHAVAFQLIETVLDNLKQAQLVGFRGSAQMNDYVYQLTEKGREQAHKLLEQCAYFGSAPVTLSAYIDSVAKQSLTKLHPTKVDLERAFTDLLINRQMFRRLGPAINSGRGLFLFGAPGNGKTSIAERVTKAFGDCIWVPRSIGIDGEIMRVFDPELHQEAPLETQVGPLRKEHLDSRWVRIRRPTIVVGGELTMDSLEVKANTGVNVSEAPIQMKSNCGTLVIDDFGRQRMTTDELLNRWIVPLEKRHDYLQMTSGTKIQVPFDQLIIFSTNLEPKDLVDDAFLRRIPYKIEVKDPSEEDFRELFQIMAPLVDVDYSAEAVDYLINTHYLPIKRPFRCCQPRDLLLQIRNYCHYLQAPPVMSPEYIDYAVENYFAIM
jgi:DNA-binding PadR family transcriptional regulator